MRARQKFLRQCHSKAGLMSLPLLFVSVFALAAEPLTITGVQAKLFFEGKGTFSADVLNTPGIALWNTQIGEGAAGAPSHSTLVLVQISGPAGTTEHGRKVHFTAQYKAGTVNARGVAESRLVQINESASIGSFGSDGKSYAAFWLYDTGCTPVSITAQIAGQPNVPVVSRTIPFRCGE